MIGQILDAGAVDAIVTGDARAVTWLAGAREFSSPLLVPALALSEVAAVRPELLQALYDLLEHPSIIRRTIDPASAPQVLEVMNRGSVYDPCGAHVVVLGRARGWKVITGDAERLRRIAPDLDMVDVVTP